ncbi:ABC transporter permease [Corallococcus interemptor]|uniref:ABC transporter permease n=1 Tax=Corallococcus interemptor TaxID=2316720 RepID=UPI0035D4AF17
MEWFLKDLRFAWRGLRRSPGFTFAVVLTLGLALGLNTVMFSLVHSLVLRPLPFPRSEDLVRLYCTQPEQSSASPSEPEVAAWAEEIQAFQGVVGLRYTSVNRTGGEVPERLLAARVTPNLLSVVGVSPIAGRPFEPMDAQPGAAPAALISHGLATRLFATPEAAPGQWVQLDGSGVLVAGVLPRGFALGDSSREPDVWLPLLLRTTPEALGEHRLTVLARLKPGVSLEAARQAAAQRSLMLHRGDAGPGIAAPPHGVEARSWQEDVTGQVRGISYALWGAALFVLMIACANVSNLLLARAVHRRKENAIRIALGASLRRRLLESIAESTLLAVLGGMVGLVFANWGIDALSLLLAPTLRGLTAPGLPPSVLLFAVGLCTGTALLLGLVPALDSLQMTLSPLLKEGHGSTGTRHRLRSGLVVFQLVMALVLLTGAGLSMRTLIYLTHVELGFQPEGVMYASLQLPAHRYPDVDSRIRAAARLEESLSSLPGVDALGLQQDIHLGGSTRSSSVQVEATDDSTRRPAEHRVASPGAFKTLGVPLRHGRLFEASDSAGAPEVAVVNESFVRVFLGGREPLGARFTFDGNRWWTVVGIVGDVRHRELTAPPAPAFYLPVGQVGPDQLTLVLRGAPAPTLRQVRTAVSGMDPELPVPSLEPLGALVARGRQRFTQVLTLLSAFSSMALALALLGIWGVVSYDVTQRGRELSIRHVLGASERSLIWLVVGETGRLVALSLLLGVPTAMGLGQGLRSLLHGVSPTDIPTLLEVAVLLGGVGLLAAWLPARRVAKTDPARALRAD